MELNLLAKKLVDAGYRMAFGITGSGPSYKLIKALTELGVKYTTVSNEAAAAVAAGSYSYLYNQKALCISIKGPGFINLLSGITACKFENFDVLCIAEEYDLEASAMQQHKRINQQQLIKELTLVQLSLTDCESISQHIENDPLLPGPKYLSLSRQDKQTHIQKTRGSILGEAELREKLEIIKKSKYPLLIIGSIIKRLNLVDVVNNLMLPILTTVQAKGTVDEHRENSAGVYTGAGNEIVPENTLITNADCIITIGLWNEEILGVTKKVDFLNFDLTSTTLTADNTCLIDLKQCKEIINQLAKKQNWASEIIHNYKLKLKKHITESLWNTGLLFDCINNVKGDFSLVVDTGFFCTSGEHIFLSNSNRPFIGSSNGRNMGLSVPMTLGISITKFPTICCFGDGGIRYHIGDIRTIVELKLPVCFILITDGNYGSVAAYVEDKNLNPVITRPLGTDWHNIMKAMAISSTSVNTLKDFEIALNSWNKKDPFFIQANFEPGAYRTFTNKIRK